MGLLGYYVASTSISHVHRIQDTEAALHQKETTAENYVNELSTDLKKMTPNALFVKYQHVFVNLYRKEGIALYVYRRDTLCFWSDNQPTIDLQINNQEKQVELIKMRNGWYEAIQQKITWPHNYTIKALIAIKTEYDFENRYLKNQFSEWFHLPLYVKLVVPIQDAGYAIKSKFGHTLFEVGHLNALYANHGISSWSSLWYLLAYVMFLISSYMLLRQKIKHKFYLILVFSLFCLVSRTIMIYMKVPVSIYNHLLYDPKLFADASSFYFSSLGDVLINSIMLFSLAILFSRINKLNDSNKTQRLPYLIVVYTVLFVVFSTQIRTLIYSLVNNSTISYNINDLFNISIYSFIGFFSVGLLLFAFYKCTEQVIFLFEGKLMHYIIFCFIVMLALGFVYRYDTSVDKDLFDYFWPLPLLLVSFFLQTRQVSRHFLGVGSIILMNAFTVSFLFHKFESINKKQTFEALALNLSDSRDIIAEHEFNKISKSIRENELLKTLISSGTQNSSQIEQVLRQQNFSGYFERYDITLSLFKHDCTPVFMHLNPMYLNEDYFLNQIEECGSPTLCKDLYFVYKEKKTMRYVAKIDIEDTYHPDKTVHLFLQMEPKLAVNLGAFPDLLLDKSLENKIESRQISYAVYESNKLLQNFGEYQYPLFINKSPLDVLMNDAYRHFLYHPQKNTTVIITEKAYGIWEKFTSNSYLFIFFSLLVLLAVWFDALVIKRNYQFSSLNQRIQFILVSVVIASLTIAVIGTIWVVNKQFELKNQKELILKSNSVLKELEQTIGEQDVLDPFYKDLATFKLKKLSQLFGSDISLFDKKGLLYASSQPAIYTQGLVSNLMNPGAYMNFINGMNVNYTQKEQIGELAYLSAYVPFYSKQNKLLGYLNLPYFSRQKDLEKELTAYLTTLINIYAILFSVTTIIALLVSDLLTKPLRIIKQQISNIQFGKLNKSLNWESNDEIGKLVAEYNNMLIKLDKSSQLLAQSERESAWREMAKQVAHEIKNPLTPMKLNIQHLQRVVESHPDDINEKVKRVSLMLIEQIDTLSHIATEFSNFAKLPNPVLEVVNLTDVLQNVTRLFQQGTHCELALQASKDLFILADKEQCLRIFTNLLKNAEQSIPEDRKGQIIINAYSLGNTVTITIQDNGNGIPDEVKQKLFTPNFTTKSTGTGLGLAIVKNAVVSFQGTISFDTEINKGTIFTLIFPQHRSHSEIID